MNFDLQIRNDLVPSNVITRLTLDEAGTPKIPFAWMVSYTSEGALQNIRYFENGVKHCKLEFPIRVFLSNWTDAIIITFVPIEAIKEIHVMEWYCTFYEISLEEAKAKLKEYPNFPYDGRNSDTVRAELIVDGGYQKLIDKSRKQYADLGVILPEHHDWIKIYD